LRHSWQQGTKYVRVGSQTQLAMSDMHGTHARFWTKTVTVPGLNEVSYTNIVDYIRQLLSEAAVQGKLLDFPVPQMGLAIVPKLNLLVPIHDGRVQEQHVTKIEGISKLDYNRDKDGAIDVILCGLSNRAQQIDVSPIEEARPIIQERLEALDAALANISDTTGPQLLSAEFAGTSPARMYRSFVAPRPKAKHILEPIERAAGRTAAQIELALRQVRADNAAYLRNIDRSASLFLNGSSTSSAIDIEIGTTGEESSHKERPVVHPVALVLDNIRSAFNVGSMFRSAETAAAAEVVTCGITAHPPHPKLRKTALSAVEVVPSRHFEDVVQAIHALKQEGYYVVVMETTEMSKVYTETTYPPKTALVLGNEITGVDARVIQMADAVVEIPCFGIKNSLNVASAAPIVLFEVLRQWKCKT